MNTPEQIIASAQAHGDRRSAVYWRGALDVLRFRLEGVRIQCPFKAGTVEFDAYFSGNDRGHALWRQVCCDADNTPPSLVAKVPTLPGEGRNQGRNRSDRTKRQVLQ